MLPNKNRNRGSTAHNKTAVSQNFDPSLRSG